MPRRTARPNADRGLVVSLCDRTGIMVQPWVDAGYRAITVDLKPAREPIARGRVHVIADVRSQWWRVQDLSRLVAVFAFPPCTDLAGSGARWFRGKGLSPLINSLQVVEACREFCEVSEAQGAIWVLENPVGVLSSFWRDPDHIFNPNEYGDPYTKRTCLWTGGGFVMPPIILPGDLFEEPTWTEPVEGSKMHRMVPSETRGDDRSVTPPGFARATFRANAPHLKKRPAPRAARG